MTALSVVRDDDVLNYEIHPVAALFPLIEGTAFEEFTEDIRRNGQREPIVLDKQGRLIDGRNRARACQALGIDVRETRHLGDDTEAWIISHNVHRRHLTESQRAMIAARLADMGRGNPRPETGRSNQSDDRFDGRESGTRQPDAARALNVGLASVGRAKAVLKSGDTDLIKAVETGVTSVTKAAEQVRHPESPVTPPRNRQPAEVRVAQIRELADKGATSAHIAKDLGIAEVQVRRLAGQHDITIRADVVRGHVRRFDHGRVLDNVTETLEVAAFSLRDIDTSQLDREQALERLDSLTSSINALSKAIKKIKESLQ